MSTAEAIEAALRNIRRALAELDPSDREKFAKTLQAGILLTPHPDERKRWARWLQGIEAGKQISFKRSSEVYVGEEARAIEDARAILEDDRKLEEEMRSL